MKNYIHQKLSKIANVLKRQQGGNKMKCIKPKHNKVLYEINKDSINNFSLLLEERRQLRSGKIKGIRVALENGEHFESDIVVNKINGKYRVIDGNHRIEAIIDYLNKFPENSIKVYLAKYENLSMAQDEQMRKEKMRVGERNIYSTWNKGTPENATDYLQQHFKTIPLGDVMLKLLPTTIYQTVNTMPLKMLAGNHVNARAAKKFEGGYSAGGEKTLADFKTITMQDIKIMRAFCQDMEEIFGKYYKNNPHYRTTAMAAFYRIWYDNRTNINRDQLIKTFRVMCVDKWKEINELSTHGGRSATITFYNICIERLNSYRKKINFISDKDVIRNKEEK